MATTVLTKQMTLNIMLKSGVGSCTRRGSVYRWRRVPLPQQGWMKGTRPRRHILSVTEAVSDKVNHFLQFIVHRINNMHIQRACKLSIKASIHNNYTELFTYVHYTYIMVHIESHHASNIHKED